MDARERHLRLLTETIEAVNSTLDLQEVLTLVATKVAAALEDMKFEVLDGGDGIMRKDDHQFFQPIYISSFGTLADKAKEPFDEENTGWGWHLVSRIDTQNTMVPTTCKMKRP